MRIRTKISIGLLMITAICCGCGKQEISTDTQKNTQLITEVIPVEQNTEKIEIQVPSEQNTSESTQWLMDIHEYEEGVDEISTEKSKDVFAKTKKDVVTVYDYQRIESVLSADELAQIVEDYMEENVNGDAFSGIEVRSKTDDSSDYWIDVIFVDFYKSPYILHTSPTFKLEKYEATPAVETPKEYGDSR